MREAVLICALVLVTMAAAVLTVSIAASII